MVGPTPRIVRIADLADARLIPYRDIRHDRIPADRFIAEGRLPVRRLLASDHQVESLLVQRGHEDDLTEFLRPDLPIYSLPRDQLAQLVGFKFHRGLLACGLRKPLRSCDELRLTGDDVPLVLALIGVTELENIGSILRTAAGFGIRHLLVGPQTGDPYSRRVIRVSMANLFSQTLYRLDDPLTQLARLTERLDLRSIATTLSADASSIADLKHDSRPQLLLIGNEADGLDPALATAASARVRIPMQLGVDSFNVAVAAAIFMYHLTTVSPPLSVPSPLSVSPPLSRER